MPTVTYNDESYTCTTAFKGEDYIHLMDSNGLMIVAFDAVTDFSGFEISDGSWVTPSSANCHVAIINEDSTISGGEVGSHNLTDGCVTAAKLADAAVTNAKLAGSSVGTSKIIDGSVTKAKLASDVTAQALGGMVSDTVWSNARSGSSFADQTISADLSGYNRVVVYFRRETDVARNIVAEASVGGTGLAFAVASNSASAPTLYNRTFTVSSTGVEFSACYTQKTNSTTRSTDNTGLVPTRIYARKGDT